MKHLLHEPGDLSLCPRTRTKVGEENQLQKMTLKHSYMPTHTYHAHIDTTVINKNSKTTPKPKNLEVICGFIGGIKAHDHLSIQRKRNTYPAEQARSLVKATHPWPQGCLEVFHHRLPSLPQPKVSHWLQLLRKIQTPKIASFSLLISWPGHRSSLGTKGSPAMLGGLHRNMLGKYQPGNANRWELNSDSGVVSDPVIQWSSDHAKL